METNTNIPLGSLVCWHNIFKLGKLSIIRTITNQIRKSMLKDFNKLLGSWHPSNLLYVRWCLVTPQLVCGYESDLLGDNMESINNLVVLLRVVGSSKRNRINSTYWHQSSGGNTVYIHSTVISLLSSGKNKEEVEIENISIFLSWNCWSNLNYISHSAPWVI